MALFKPFRGSRTSLDAQPLHDGYAYFCTDDGSFHIDYLDTDGNLQRKQINANNAETLCGMSLEEIKAYVSVQADWNQTDSAQADFIKNKPEVVSEAEFLAWLNDASVVEPLASTSGEIYTTKNNELYIL